MIHSAEYIKRNKKRIRLLSVDLFDTLVTRTFARPTDLFFALEKQLNQEEEKYSHFAKARIESEFQLRKEKAFKQEVTLEEIYARLQSNMMFSPKQTQQAQKRELHMEEQCIIPIKQTVDMINALKDTGKVILVSDTYLPEGFIVEILKKNRLEHLFHRLYISSTHKVMKSTGSMFRLIKQKENIPLKKWLHVGDNKESDYRIPGRMGIKTLWLKESLLTRYERNYVDNPGDYHSQSIFAGLLKQTRLESPYNKSHEKVIRETTIDVSAPLLIAYVQWCLTKAKAMGLTRLYFMARDGQILHKIANILKPPLPSPSSSPLENRYLYVSRQSLLFPAMKDLDDESLEWVLAPTSIVTPRIILARINIDPSEIKNILKKHGYNHPDRNIPKKELHHFKTLLLEKEIKQLIQNRVKLYRKNTLAYLQQEGLEKDGKFALVDIGWNGTLQRSISRLLEMQGKDFPINGFYLGLRREIKHKNADRLEAFFFSPGNPHGLEKESYIIPMIELFAAADHGGVIKYEPIIKAGQIKAILKNKKNSKGIRWGVKVQHQAMETLAEKIKENNIDCSGMENIIFENTRSFITNPTREEAGVYGSFPIAEDQNEAYSLPMAEKYNLFQLFKHFKQGFQHHHNEWKEAARKLSNQPFTRLLEKLSSPSKKNNNKIQGNKMKFLNVGCGSCFHPDWENIDLAPRSPRVKRWDIKKQLPYPRETFAAVYSSHLLEHLTPHQARFLLKEMKRVLEKDGIIRVVVPDLEAIARVYLEKLEAALDNSPGAEDDYDWILLELLDQTTRSSTGGEMLKFLVKENLNNKDFIMSRVGQEAENIWRSKPLNQGVKALQKKNFKKTLAKRLVRRLCGKEAAAAFQEGLFRNSGEIHRWMYDRFSLKRLLENSGFKEVKACRAHESRIPDFNSYCLDTTQEGKIRKPDSLFMEGKK